MTVRKKEVLGRMGKYSKVLGKVSLEKENDLKLPWKRDGIGEGRMFRKMNQHVIQDDWRKIIGLKMFISRQWVL